MGFGGISVWQLLIVLLIVVLLFGTKRLKSIGGDLGEAIKGFRKSVNAEDDDKDKPNVQHKTGDTLDVHPEKKPDQQHRD